MSVTVSITFPAELVSPDTEEGIVIQDVVKLKKFNQYGPPNVRSLKHYLRCDSVVLVLDLLELFSDETHPFAEFDERQSRLLVHCNFISSRLLTNRELQLFRETVERLMDGQLGEDIICGSGGACGLGIRCDSRSISGVQRETIKEVDVFP